MSRHNNEGFPVMMSACFWCGERNEILIGQRLVANVDQVPSTVVRDYEPCDKCKANMKSGVALIEADDKPFSEKQPPIQQNAHGTLYPSGRWVVVKPESIDNFVTNPAMAEKIKEHGISYINPEVFARLMPEDPASE